MKALVLFAHGGDLRERKKECELKEQGALGVDVIRIVARILTLRDRDWGYSHGGLQGNYKKATEHSNNDSAPQTQETDDVKNTYKDFPDAVQRELEQTLEANCSR